MSENLGVSVELAREILIHAGVAADEGEALLQAFRAESCADVVTGFFMFEDACSFSIRDVTYLEPGER